MRVVFFCTCLEPGKDGVGDYSLLLASELIRSGKDVSVIALNDRFTGQIVESIVNSNGIPVPILRLPHILKAKKRWQKASNYVEVFSPDWLILQYVPFGFNKKGLPFFLGSALKSLKTGAKWQVMFHELWVGMESGSGFKMKSWGILQRFLIVSMIKKLKPACIFSQIPLYVHQLSLLGFRANLLPLFGNIPVPNYSILPKKDKYFFNLLVFGNIHYGAPIEEWAKYLRNWCTANKADCKIVFAGKNGSQLDTWKQAFESNSFTVKVEGFLPTPELAKLFINCDLGISSTPDLLIGKSGSAAAMIDFGLPIVCVSRNWKVKSFTEPNRMTDTLENAFEKILTRQRIINTNSLNDVAGRFLTALNAHG